MNRIAFEVPPESLLALKLSPESLAAELRMAAAVKLFELGRVFRRGGGVGRGAPGGVSFPASRLWREYLQSDRRGTFPGDNPCLK